MSPPSSGPRWFPVGDDSVRLLHDGAQAFPAMLEAIEAARKEVLAEYYWITPDGTGRRFRDALVARARAGVTVRVLYDSLGSRGSSLAWWRPLIDAGGSVAEYHALSLFREAFALHQLAQRDHRKLLVLDGEVGFTGGLNLGDPWAPLDQGGGGWRDDVIQARGPIAVEMRALFYRTWRRVTRELVPSGVGPLARRTRGERVFVLASQRRRRRNIHREYLTRVRAAQRTIDLAHAYFLPERRLRVALQNAAARGVRVRVLVPEVSDVPGLHFAVEASFDTLLESGVEVYALPPPMLHSKTAIVDERFVTIGSYNLDERSWRSNLEANLGVVDEAFAREVTAAFERDLARAHRVDDEAWRRRSLARRGAQWLARALHELW